MLLKWSTYSLIPRQFEKQVKFIHNNFHSGLKAFCPSAEENERENKRIEKRITTWIHYTFGQWKWWQRTKSHFINVVYLLLFNSVRELILVFFVCVCSAATYVAVEIKPKTLRVTRIFMNISAKSYTVYVQVIHKETEKEHEIQFKCPTWISCNGFIYF